MKKTIIKSLILAGLAVFGLATAQAQTAKVVAVDMAKAREGYLKMKDYDKVLQTFAQSQQEDINKQVIVINDLGKAMSELSEKFNKATDAKEKTAIQGEAETKNIELQSKQAVLRSMIESGNKQIADVKTDLFNRAQAEIIRAADLVAKQLKASVLIADVTMVQYYDFQPIDITKDVLTELNKGLPVTADKPASTTAAPAMPAK